jgi:hypothetical protein
MTTYVLVLIACLLLVIAGVQFFYLAFLERRDKQQKRRIRELERQTGNLFKRLGEAEFRISKQQTFFDSIESVDSAEIWADLISDH